MYKGRALEYFIHVHVHMCTCTHTTPLAFMYPYMCMYICIYVHVHVQYMYCSSVWECLFTLHGIQYVHVWPLWDPPYMCMVVHVLLCVDVWVCRCMSVTYPVVYTNSDCSFAHLHLWDHRVCSLLTIHPVSITTSHSVALAISYQLPYCLWRSILLVH